MTSSQEHVILVDDGDRPIGTAEKLDAHRRGVLHRAFSIIVWDSHGRQLLQKRAAGKYHSGGLWTNTCCGHPRPGEGNQSAAERRLREEMGFECALAPLGMVRYHAHLDNGMTEHEIVHVFRGFYEGPIAADPFEAEGYQWRELGEIREDMALAPNRYTVWFRQYIAEQWPVAVAATA